MKTLYVAKNGTITSINNALKLIENDPTEISLHEGIYFEKINVQCDNIIIKGNCKDNTIISYNDFASKIDHNGQEYNTFRTATMFILGNNIKLENLTIENSSGISQKFGQAVALHLLGDKIHLKNCIIKSYQDTIFCGPLPLDLQTRYEGFLNDDMRVTKPIARSYFEECEIYGDVDFIFGSGNAVFYKCKIISNGTSGYIAAPSTEKTQKYGLSFIDCEFVNGGVAQDVYLARPWRDYGACAFINCKYDNHINPFVFNKWNNTNRDQTCRFYYYNLPFPNVFTWAKKANPNDYSLSKIFHDWDIK